MRALHRYKHKNCLDMHIDVLRVQYVAPTYIKVRVQYTDPKGRPYPVDLQTIKIQTVDLPKWRFVS